MRPEQPRDADDSKYRHDRHEHRVRFAGERVAEQGDEDRAGDAAVGVEHGEGGRGEHEELEQVPTTLEGALQALEADHEYLEAGDVFSSDLIDTWVRIKREDLAELQQRPHPYEFDLYYDI